jgi:hypothetical protein
MDCQTLIVEIANAFLAVPNSYENITDLIDATIDDYVGQNDIETNQKIVMEYSGGVYEAIQLFEFHLGNACDLHKGTKSKFYQQLAYVSLFVKLYPQIKAIVDAPLSSSSSDISMAEVSDYADDDNMSPYYELSSDNEDRKFSWNDTNGDIADMLHETIKSYKRHKAASGCDDLYSGN